MGKCKLNVRIKLPDITTVTSCQLPLQEYWDFPARTFRRISDITGGYLGLSGGFCSSGNFPADLRGFPADLFGQNIIFFKKKSAGNGITGGFIKKFGN